MPHFDLPLDELREYRSATVAPNDLDAYWEDAIREARDHAAPATFEPYKAEAYGPLEVFDVTYSGAAGHPAAYRGRGSGSQDHRELVEYDGPCRQRDKPLEPGMEVFSRHDATL